jgi:LPS-assembly protein
VTPRPISAWILVVACACGAARAQQQEELFPRAPEKKEEKPRTTFALPGIVAGEATGPPALAAETITEIAEGVYRLEGYADVRYGGMRLQADRATYDSKRQLADAEGNVILEQGEGTLGAARLEMNLHTGAATMWDVTGYLPPYYQFRAERLERIDVGRFWIYGAVFTTCTQPVPYWSFRVKRAFIELEQYAHLHGASFRSGKAPIVYFPYLLWPVKRDRASGFLLPEIGNSNSRGFYLGMAYFWAIRRNLDATFYADYYSIAGPAGGLEFRYKADERGSGQFTGYYLPSDVDPAESRRYRMNYHTDQPIGESWRLLADLNKVSDNSYYNDFERDLGLSVSPYQISFADLQRGWATTTLDLRAERREQFLSGTQNLLQERLPEVEVRGRSRRLGESPVYVSFQGSGSRLERQQQTLDADYGRLDAEATITAPWTATPWLDVNPSLSLRETYYSQRADPTDPSGVADEGLNRFTGTATVEFVGPRFDRVFEAAPGSQASRYKNTLEPRLTYTYLPEFKDRAEVLVYDEVDFIPSDVNLVTYGLTSRLLRRRPSPPDRKAAPGTAPTYEAASEIASVEIRQSAAFNQALSRSTALDPATLEFAEESSFSPITFAARYNPTPLVSADVRLDYDILYDSLRSVSVSGTASSDQLGRVALSYFLNRDPAGVQPHAGTLRLGGGSALFQKRFIFDLDFAYDLPTHLLQSQRYRLGYETQCCGFQAEYLNRDYAGLVQPAREFRFTVSLKGVGNFLDLHSRFN